MMFAQKNSWHFETAPKAGSVAPYLRSPCGRVQIEQLQTPSLDSSPPDS